MSKVCPIHQAQIISLDNFDPKSSAHLDSPRSIDACKRQGIDVSELIRIPFNEFKKTIQERNLDKETIKALWDRYNIKREEKYRIVIDVNHC